MRRRMVIALAAVPGFFISLYLLLYKLGVYGQLVCGQGGSCSLVQSSSYATFLGVPVAGWGGAWYAVVLGVATWGVHRAGAGDDGDGRRLLRPGPLLLGLAVAGFLFSAYLTWAELFVIGAVCRWCLVSAGITTLILGLALPEARAWSGGRRDGGERAAPS